MRQTNKIKELEPFIQEFEQILSRDFNNMNLEQLKQSQDDFCKVAGMKDDRETISPTDEQTKARDLMWFRITEEEHKNDKVKTGDLFHTSWGYDQTNTEMYKVVGFTKSGKSAIVREIGMKTKEGSEGFMSDQVMPDPNNELKRQIYDEKKHYNIDTNENKPDLKVKISRSSSWHPYKQNHIEIGEIHLRGLVYYAGESKHLQNLYRIKKDGSAYRSWYA